MNNTFEWSRFCEVVKKDFRNMWPLYGHTLFIIALLPMALWLLTLVLDVWVGFGPFFRIGMLLMVSLLAGCMTASRMYRTWNLPGEGVYFAMLPASKLEKYLSALLFTVVVCPLAVFIGSAAIDVLLTALPIGNYRLWLWESDPNFHVVNPNGGPYLLLFEVGAVLRFLTAMMLFVFTSTFFKRHKVLKTFMWCILVDFLLWLVSIKLNNMPSVGQWLREASKSNPQAIADYLFYGVAVFYAVTTVLFGWLGWRRIKKMSY